MKLTPELAEEIVKNPEKFTLFEADVIAAFHSQLSSTEPFLLIVSRINGWAAAAPWRIGEKIFTLKRKSEKIKGWIRFRRSGYDDKIYPGAVVCNGPHTWSYDNWITDPIPFEYEVKNER